MRTIESINEIIIHCADTYQRMDIGVKEIRKWHLDRGWNDIGYHFVIRRDGTVETGRNIDKVGSHVKGRNTNTIGICLVGGRGENDQPEDNFTFRQIIATRQLIDYIKLILPCVDLVSPHSLYSSYKTCPNFDIYERLEIKENMV